jgi:microcystin-dependent protein
VYIGSSSGNLKSIGSITTSQIDMKVGTDWYVYPSDGSLKTTIKHNDDGSASFVFKGTGFGKGTAESTYSTANGDFPSIPSASVMGAISSFTIDDGLTVPVTQYVSSYYEKLEVMYGSTVFKTIKAGKGVKNIEVKFTESELDTIYSTIKTGSSAQFTFRLTTYSDSGYSKKIGNSSTKNAQGSFVTQLPTFSDFGYYDANSEAVDVTGSNQTIIARVSNVWITISASQLAKANTRKASISHYVINGDKVTSTGGAVSCKLGSVTSNKVTIQAVDTRGDASLVVTKEFTKYIDYNRVSVNTANWSLARRDNGVGRLIDISFEATWYQGGFGKTTNTLTPYVFYRNTEDGYWTDMNEFIKGASIGKLDETKIDTSTPGVVRYSGQLLSAEDDKGFDIQIAYDMFIGFQDTFSDEGLMITAPYGQPAAAVYKNKMALGGPYDESLGGTQLWGDVYVNGQPLSTGGTGGTSGSVAFPIGYIYMSVIQTNPSVFFGGTWEQLKDVFLLAAGDTYNAGTTGGEAEVQLTIETMPEHNHMGWWRQVGATGTQEFVAGLSDSYEGVAGARVASETGGNKPHNNMPPYLTVYMWKRIA